MTVTKEITIQRTDWSPEKGVHSRDHVLVTPLIYNQIPYPDYAVDYEGDIWSKRRGYWQTMSPSASGNSPYPHTSAINYLNETKRLQAHVAVHETLNPKLPCPPAIPLKDWEVTPSSVKSQMRSLWQVNHIDHDPENYHPSNLEWTTAQENVNKYQAYRRKQLIEN